MAHTVYPADYKRNQVEWAIWHLIDRGQLRSEQPPTILRHKIKRLIDVDRQIDVKAQATELWRHCYAFLQGSPQGTGGENVYRLEEAVALWMGLQLLDMGLPQRGIIHFIRALKPRLDRVVGEILGPHIEEIVSLARDPGGPPATRLREGSHLDADDLVYVATEQVDASGVEALSRRGRGSGSNICHGSRELLSFIEAHVPRSKRCAIIEIGNAVLSLAYFLLRAPTVRRGPAPS
jgi:hypothetical protein